MCEQGTTAHVVVNGNEVVDVDACIAPIVRILNDAGIGTVASCCGHGHRPGNIALADGRELIIARSYEEARVVDRATPDIHGAPPHAGIDPLALERGLSEWERTCLAWAEGYIGRRKGEDERTFAGGAQAVIARLLSVPLLWRQPSLAQVVEEGAKRFDERPRYRASVEAQRELARLDPLTVEERHALERVRRYIVGEWGSRDLDKGARVLDRLLRLSDAGVPEPKPCAHGHDCPQCPGGAECACEPPVREPTDEELEAWCAQCGPHVDVDEDGCCASCGTDATGEGADRAVAALAELGRIRRELSSLAERLEDTFLGGYSNDRELEIFRHGMGTAASCVEAVLRGERNQAPDVRGPHPKTSSDAGGRPEPALVPLSDVEKALTECEYLDSRNAGERMVNATLDMIRRRLGIAGTSSDAGGEG